VTLDFDEGDELRALRAAVADLGSRYGQPYFLEQARSGGRTDALWAEAGKAGFLGVNLPEEYGGGGAAWSSSRWSSRSWGPRAARC
jgi:alkylation response protein AidB-like acyl-CoA dehydrogenase